MGNADTTVSSRCCPNCGLEIPLSGWEGLCPRCLVKVSVRGAALAEAQAVPEAQAQSQTSGPGSRAGAGRAHPGFGGPPEPMARGFADYQLEEEIGRGGMGVVFKARQRSLNRTVAVKILLAGPLAGGQLLERFRTEAEAIAQLHHPGIVAIYEAGRHEGTSFFSMEYVPGGTLADLVSLRPLPPEVAARYVREVAEAIRYAHERGILHRDLKPSNVLIDASGNVRITDFGLAKRFAAVPDGLDSRVNAALTMTGHLLGSPSYLAPEQAGAKGATVGPASDTYALGAILFHLLTGRPPFLAETIEGTLLQVLTTEPVGVRRLNPAVPRDLETICAKCLQKEPTRRYRSAQALADDLGRFLRHEPIHARPANPVEKLWRWGQRRPALAGILLLLHLSFAAGLGGILWQWRRAHQSQRSLQRSLYATDVNLAQVALEDNNLGRATSLLQRYIPKSAGEPDLRGFEWRYLWGLCRGDQVASLPGDGSILSCVRFSPDGRWIASAGFDRAVTIWETATRRPLVRLSGLSGPVCRLALSFSPNGKLIAAAGGTDLLVWTTHDWKVVQRLAAHSAPLAGGAYAVAFTPDGQGLAARIGAAIHVWDTATWRQKSVIPGAIDQTATLLAYSRDGKILATYNKDHLHFLEAATGRETIAGQEEISQPLGLAFAPDDSVLALGDASGTLRLIDPRTGKTLNSVAAHKGLVQGVKFSPNGRTLASSGADQLVRLWDANTLQNLAVLKGHQNEVWSITFSPDGQTLASASKDGTVKLWSVKPSLPRARVLDGPSTPCWFAPDGQVLLGRSWKGSLLWWDLQTAAERRVLGPLPTGAERYFTTVSADGKYLATSVADGRIFLWDLQADRCLWTNRVDGAPANALAFSPDNRRLALSTGQYLGGRWQGGTRLLDLASGQTKMLSSDYCGTRDHACVAFSPDGNLLAGAGPNYTIRLWDLRRSRERAPLKGHAWNVMSLAFSPDGRLLASGADDSTARLWDLASGMELARLTGHKTGIVQVAFSPDGRTLATSGNDQTVYLWNVATHRELLAIKVATTWTHLLFSPDGQILATGGTSGPLELWRAPTE